MPRTRVSGAASIGTCEFQPSDTSSDCFVAASGLDAVAEGDIKCRNARFEGAVKAVEVDEMASKTLDVVNSRPEFEVYAHRGAALAQRLRNADIGGAGGGEAKKLD